MDDILGQSLCCCCQLCAGFFVECCCKILSDTNFSTGNKERRSLERSSHYEESKLSHSPKSFRASTNYEESNLYYNPIPTAPLAYQELIPVYSQSPIYINEITNYEIGPTEPEIIISAHEKILNQLDSNPQPLIYSILQDSLNNQLPLHLAKEKLREYTDPRNYSKDLLEGFLHSLEKGRMCYSNLLILAVILTADCPQSIKGEILFNLYCESNHAGILPDMVISRMVAQTFDVSIRHLSKLVQDSEVQSEKVRKYCSKLEEGRGLYIRNSVSMMLDGKIELNRSEFMIKIEDQLYYLMSSSGIRNEVYSKYLPN